MDKHLDTLASEIKEVKLTEEERAKARRVVDAYAQGAQELASKGGQSTSSSRSWRTKKVYYIGIAVIILAAIVINWFAGMVSE